MPQNNQAYYTIGQLYMPQNNQAYYNIGQLYMPQNNQQVETIFQNSECFMDRDSA
jgi:hypothetical protein